MRRDSFPLALRHAIALGLVQGPAELLPISSSAHTTLVPWLAGWRYGELNGELRKSFEVALHAGTAAALMIDARHELIAWGRRIDRTGAVFLLLASVPAVFVGYALERPIERRLGSPGTIAAGLAAGGVGMALADARPARPSTEGREARPRDGLALGLAQALALIPGVSRSGATLAAARALGYSRADAKALSWQAALPVLLGASALKGARLARRGTPRGSGRALAAGAIAAFLSTRASARLLEERLVLSAAGGRDRAPRLLPYAVYRCLLAALVARRLRTTPPARRPQWER